MLSSFLHSKRVRPVCCFPHTDKDDACAKRTPTKQTSLPPSDSGRSTQSVVCARNRVWIGGARPSFLTVAQSQRQRGDMQRRTLQKPFSQRSKRTLVSPNRKRGLRVVFHTPTKMMHAQKRLQRNKRRFLPTPEALCSGCLRGEWIDSRAVPKAARRSGTLDRKELLFLPTASEALLFSYTHKDDMRRLQRNKRRLRKVYAVGCLREESSMDQWSIRLSLR